MKWLISLENHCEKYTQCGDMRTVVNIKIGNVGEKGRPDKSRAAIVKRLQSSLSNQLLSGLYDGHSFVLRLDYCPDKLKRVGNSFGNEHAEPAYGAHAESVVRKRVAQIHL